MTNLSLLIDDWNSILKLHIIEQALKENIGYSNKAVVFLLVVEGISSPEISSHHLQTNPDSCQQTKPPSIHFSKCCTTSSVKDKDSIKRPDYIIRRIDTNFTLGKSVLSKFSLTLPDSWILTAVVLPAASYCGLHSLTKLCMQAGIRGKIRVNETLRINSVLGKAKPQGNSALCIFPPHLHPENLPGMSLQKCSLLTGLSSSQSFHSW